MAATELTLLVARVEQQRRSRRRFLRLPCAIVLAAGEEYVRTDHRSTCVEWMPEVA
jgi:hypothetical protein